MTQEIMVNALAYGDMEGRKLRLEGVMNALYETEGRLTYELKRICEGAEQGYDPEDCETSYELQIQFYDYKTYKCILVVIRFDEGRKQTDKNGLRWFLEENGHQYFWQAEQFEI